MRCLVLLAGKMGQQIQKQIQRQLIKRYQKTQLHLSCKEVVPPLVQLLLATFKQWGVNTAGYVSFPISFVFRSIVLTTHQGIGYLQSWPVEYSPKAGFTLRVDQNSDSQWISIGY